MKQIRPLSPHLTIYKPQITAMLSIFHRITGVVLSLIIILLILFYKIITLDFGNYFFYSFSYLINSTVNGLIYSIIFLILITFYYHFFNGFRHLIWDNGKLLEIKKVYQTGYIVLLLTFIFTLISGYSFFINY